MISEEKVVSLCRSDGDFFFLQNNTKSKKISLVSTFSKQFSKLTSQA